jgi:hypothetical protein
MSGFDEPALGGEFAATSGKRSAEPGLRERICALMTEQPYAVLCTQGGGQPYGSVIAFAANQALNGVVFATPVATRKYRLLIDCDRVALVVDNRAGFPGDISRIDAVTATGSALRLTETGALEHWRNLLVRKHPHLHDFVDAPSTALFRIDIVRYLHVVRLQEVHQWTPPRHS